VYVNAQLSIIVVLIDTVRFALLETYASFHIHTSPDGSHVCTE